HAHRPPAGHGAPRAAHGVGGDRPGGAQGQAGALGPYSAGDRHRRAGAALRRRLDVGRGTDRGAAPASPLRAVGVGFPIEPPIEPMLSKAAAELPEGDGWLFEPKWDGFRAIVFRDRDRVYLQSRDLKPLDRYFPELQPAFLASLPARCVVDGEIVIAGERGLDFEALQMRLHPAASRVAKLAAETPASFVAFDLLAEGDADLRARPHSDRCARTPSGRTRGGSGPAPWREGLGCRARPAAGARARTSPGSRSGSSASARLSTTTFKAPASVMGPCLCAVVPTCAQRTCVSTRSWSLSWPSSS